MIGNIIQDVRYGLRVLRKAPAFTAVAVITLALGIGANAAMFAVFSAFLLRPLPFRDADRLVALWDKRPDMRSSLGGLFLSPMSHYRVLMEQSHTLQEVAAFQRYQPRVAGPSGATKIKAVKCSANLLNLLGFSVAAGRNFSADETTPGRNNVTVITAGYAVDHFGSPRAAVGKSLTLDGAAHVVLGVLPKDFRMPNLMAGEMRPNPQLLLPLDTSATAAAKPGPFINMIARVKPNFTLDQVRSDIDIIAKPKGKRPLSINQLSGGEKTLTATAILFSLYLLKPAPFCIFDEVDAPLDDTNIDKFNNIIRTFSKDSQFIIVSHNKRTIASTDVIYGVTMVEQGISRVVPVDLRELAD